MNEEDRSSEEIKALHARLLLEEGIANAAKAEVDRLADLLFKSGRMLEAPCFLCGYNGAGYFNPDKHICAERHHKLFEEGAQDEDM